MFPPEIRLIYVMIIKSVVREKTMYSCWLVLFLLKRVSSFRRWLCWQPHKVYCFDAASKWNKYSIVSNFCCSTIQSDFQNIYYYLLFVFVVLFLGESYLFFRWIKSMAHFYFTVGLKNHKMRIPSRWRQRPGDALILSTDPISIKKLHLQIQ